MPNVRKDFIFLATAVRLAQATARIVLFWVFAIRQQYLIICKQILMVQTVVELVNVATLALLALIIHITA